MVGGLSYCTCCHNMCEVLMMIQQFAFLDILISSYQKETLRSILACTVYNMCSIDRCMPQAYNKLSIYAITAACILYISSTLIVCQLCINMDICLFLFKCYLFGFYRQHLLCFLIMFWLFLFAYTIVNKLHITNNIFHTHYYTLGLFCI